MKRLTREYFIDKANDIHNGKYDYSKVEYINSKTKVCIICPEHGEFWQNPNSHLSGQCCPYCQNRTKMDNETFVNKARKIHGDKYDYSKVEYVNNKTKVCIICPEHGEFWQSPNTHLNGHGCSKCVGLNKSSTEEFIGKATEIHNGKYDYSKVEYINSKTKVCIICPEHGEFWQIPSDHLIGKGCPKCGKKSMSEKRSLTTHEFIHKAILIHQNKYDYSKVGYVSATNKVCIICPEHGEFWQRPSDHINLRCGCPKCKSSHMENEIRSLLSENNIYFEEQKKFEWLRNQSLDFYLPDYDIAIECQGLQHFVSVNYFGGNEGFLKRNHLDDNKKKACMENGIKLIYYANYDGFDFPYEVITDKNEIITMLNNIMPKNT